MEFIERQIFVYAATESLSTDHARLCEVEPRALVQAVKRNVEGLPADFVFQLDQRE